MHPSVSMFRLAGIPIYTYGLMLMSGAAAFAVLFLSLLRGREKDAGFAALPLMTLAGLAVSRLFFCLMDESFYQIASLKNALRPGMGGLSMAGAMVGAFAALFAAARLKKADFARMRDAFAASLPLFILFARVGESQTSLGVSRPLVTGLLDGSFLAFRDTYNAYLKTWLLEAAAAAVLLCVFLRLLKREHRGGDVFDAAMLVFGSTQVLMESLRYDAHMRFSFISMQQIFAACLFGFGLLFIARKGAKAFPAKARLLVILLPLVVAGALGLEFLIDRSRWNKALLYAAYALMMGVPVYLAMRLRKQVISLGKSQN